MLLFSSGLAAADTSPPDAQRFADKVYEGVVTARIEPPKGSGILAKNQHGNGTAELKRTGRNRANFVLIGNIAEDNDASFGSEGRFQAGQWRGDGAIPVTISADGTISGKGTSGDNQFTIDGRITENRLDAFVEILPGSATAGGFPVGTSFQFKYSFRHFKPASTDGKRASGKGECREIVYRLKLVPNFSGGAMGMVRVPECRR